MTSDYLQTNRRLWDEWTPIHLQSAMYDVVSFKEGRSTLWPLEIEEAGEVAGKRLLHLQCHFGADTLSWARLGAAVTGVDFSPKAIDAARALAAEVGIDACFVCADVLELDQALDGEFDVIYTGGGAINWLPDLQRWGRVVANFLAPGGTFYLREYHPFAYLFDDSENAREPSTITYPYFAQREPLQIPVKGSYADPEAQVSEPHSYSWVYAFQDIFDALIGAGLRIQFLHEFPFVGEKLFPFVEQRDDGLWYARGCDLPLMFSIRAVKDG